MIVLRALALVFFILIPGWLAVSLLKKDMESLDKKEKLLLVAVLGIGIIALSALVLALASYYSLTRLLFLVGSESALLAVIARRRVSWIINLDLKDILFTLAIVGIALAIFSPPGRTVLGWSDVGIYANIAGNIQREGGVASNNTIAASVDPSRRDLLFLEVDYPFQEGVYFENQFFTVEDFTTGRVRPWFYFLWPSLLAVFASFLGVSRMFWAVTAMGVLSLWGLFILARRLLGYRYAIIVAVLGAVSPFLLYFSRYTTSEMMNLVFFLSGSLCLVSYMDQERTTQARSLAGISAFLFTLGFLCRVDFLYLVIPLTLCFSVKGTFKGLSPGDIRFLSLLACGAILSLILGISFSRIYFLSSWTAFYGSWKWFAVAGLAILILLITLAVVYRNRLRKVTERLTVKRIFWIVPLCILISGVFIYLYYIRPGSSESVIPYGFFKAIEGPSYEKQSLVRWAWYLSFTGLLLVFVGYTTWFSRRRSFSEITIAFMGITFTIAYAWNMQALPMHILAIRRLLPVIIPLALIMIAYSLKSIGEIPGTLFKRERSRKLGGIAARVLVAGLFLYLVLFAVHASVPILGLQEGGNQLELCRELADDISGDGAVLLDYHLGDLFGPPLRCLYGVQNAWLMDKTEVESGEFAHLLDDLGFPEQPIYLVWRPRMSGEEPVLAKGLDAELVGEYILYEETLEKSFTHRPGEREFYEDTIQLYRLQGK